MGNCLDVDDMEEEVQVRVQVEVEREEQGIGETHGKEQGEEQRVKEQTIAQRVWSGALVQTLEPMWCITHHETRALCKRKSDV